MRGRSFSDDDVEVITEALDEKIERAVKGDGLAEPGAAVDLAAQRTTLARLFRTREKIAPVAAAAARRDAAAKPANRSRSARPADDTK
jgi:hypothetical protein